jgi:prevent-host-death family protein
LNNVNAVHEEIGVYDAKTKLAELLRRVEAGESFTITNRGNPVAELIPSQARSKSKSVKAIEAMLRSRVDAVTDEHLLELKEEGRR